MRMPLIVLAVLTSLVTTANADDTHFRNTTWGMSRAEVIAAESQPQRCCEPWREVCVDSQELCDRETIEPPKADGPNKVTGTANLYGRPSIVEWEFLEDKLVKASYNHVTQYYHDCETFLLWAERALREKYGFSDDDRNWSTPETFIFLQRKTNRGLCTVSISYSSKEFQPLIDAAEKEASKNDLEKM